MIARVVDMRAEPARVGDISALLGSVISGANCEVIATMGRPDPGGAAEQPPNYFWLELPALTYGLKSLAGAAIWVSC